jgi:hypothetical protein
MGPELHPEEDSDSYAPRHAGSGGPPSRRRWLARGALAIVTVLVLTVAMENLVSPGSSVPGAVSTSSPPNRGVACAQLKQAYDRRAAGDEVGFLKAARVADQYAERALQESYVLFGPPERIAVELYLRLVGTGAKFPPARIDRLMTAARDHCAGLGRWST